MATETKKKVTSDVVVDADPLYCFESAPLYNSAVGALDDTAIPDVVGQPLKLNSGNWELLLDTDEANCNGICVGGPRSNLVEKDGSLDGTSATEENFLILARSPCVIRDGSLNADDDQGDTFDQAALKTALEALGFVFRAEPTITEEQTT